MHQIKFNELVNLYIRVAAAIIIKNEYDEPSWLLPIERFNLLVKRVEMIRAQKAEIESRKINCNH